jgi:hypothetical protein
MPTGPKGQKRPADLIGNAVKLMRIATGQVEERTGDEGKNAAAELGSKVGKARASHLPRLPAQGADMHEIQSKRRRSRPHQLSKIRGRSDPNRY